MDEWAEAREFDKNMFVPTDPHVRVANIVHEVKHRGAGGGWTACELTFAWDYVPKFSRHNVLDAPPGEPCDASVRLTCVTCIAEEPP